MCTVGPKSLRPHWQKCHINLEMIRKFEDGQIVFLNKEELLQGPITAGLQVCELCRNWVSCIQILTSPSEDQFIKLSSLTVRKAKSSETQNLFNKQHKSKISLQQTAAAVVDSLVVSAQVSASKPLLTKWNEAKSLKGPLCNKDDFWDSFPAHHILRLRDGSRPDLQAQSVAILQVGTQKPTFLQSGPLRWAEM